MRIMEMKMKMMQLENEKLTLENENMKLKMALAQSGVQKAEKENKTTLETMKETPKPVSQETGGPQTPMEDLQSVKDLYSTLYTDSESGSNLSDSSSDKSSNGGAWTEVKKKRSKKSSSSHSKVKSHNVTFTGEQPDWKRAKFAFKSILHTLNVRDWVSKLERRADTWTDLEYKNAREQHKLKDGVSKRR